MTPKKVVFSTQLPPEVAAQVRRAVVQLQLADPGMTIARFTEEALTAALEELPAAPETALPTSRPRPGRRVGSPQQGGGN